MMENEFYITLLSNSSMQYFSDNTTTKFITKLPKSIKLDGHWSVSLVEFQYPCSMINVQDGENEITLRKKCSPINFVTETVYDNFYVDDYGDIVYNNNYHIPIANYVDVMSILQTLNSQVFLRQSKF